MVAILTIAGSDPTGGAGIQADLRVFEKLGVQGASAVTAITAQTRNRFLTVHPTPADVLTQQLSAISEDIKFDVIKIGMVATAANVHAIMLFLHRFPKVPVVVDPVFDSSTGYPLVETEALPVFEHHLLPLATVVTPNLEEAETLAKMRVSDIDTMTTAAKTIHEDIRRMRGGGEKKLCVVVTGGHLKNRSTDIFFDGDEVTKLEGELLKIDLHGSGCLYSSALAAYLALGQDAISAARSAKGFVTEILKDSLQGRSER